MKKRLSVALLLIIMFPVLVNASWYNPLSWFSFLFPKPQVIEKIIYIQATTTPVIQQVEVATTTEPIKTIIKQPAKVLVKITPTQVPVIQVMSSPQIDWNATYTTVINKYNTLLLKERATTQDNNNSSTSTPARGQFLDNLETDLDADIHVLDKYFNDTQKSADIVQEYQTKINNYTNDFNQEESDYMTSETKITVISFMQSSLANINNPDVQTNCYKMFYLYDKVFGTSYATKFTNALTAEQKSEVVSEFLLDTGN